MCSSDAFASPRSVSGWRRDPGRNFGAGSPQSPRERIIDASTQDEVIAGGALIDDFPRPMYLGEQLSIAG